MNSADKNTEIYIDILIPKYIIFANVSNTIASREWREQLAYVMSNILDGFRTRCAICSILIVQAGC